MEETTNPSRVWPRLKTLAVILNLLVVVILAVSYFQNRQHQREITEDVSVDTFFQKLKHGELRSVRVSNSELVGLYSPGMPVGKSMVRAELAQPLTAERMTELEDAAKAQRTEIVRK